MPKYWNTSVSVVCPFQTRTILFLILDEQPAGKGGQGQSEGGEHQGFTVTAHGGPATAVHHQPQQLQVSIT